MKWATTVACLVILYVSSFHGYRDRYHIVGRSPLINDYSTTVFWYVPDGPMHRWLMWAYRPLIRLTKCDQPVLWF